jgi:hypothetical protein
MNRAIVICVAAATLLAAKGAIAQDLAPVEEWKIGPGIAGTRLHESDVVKIPLRYHHLLPNPPWAGWSGYKYTVHVLDNSEVDIDAVTPYPFVTTDPPTNGPVQIAGDPTHNPFGPRSQNVVSVPREWKVIHPSAPNSGINVQPTNAYHVADLDIHIKGTNNPRQNSDVDAVVRLWNIWHFRGDFNSAIVELRPSDRVWVGSQIDNLEQLHRPDSIFELPPTIPTPPLSSPDGHWLHVQQPIPFHFVGSQFYATLARVYTIGIEHVPEPATGALCGLGVLCAVMGVRSHRRRRSL